MHFRRPAIDSPLDSGGSHSQKMDLGRASRPRDFEAWVLKKDCFFWQRVPRQSAGTGSQPADVWPPQSLPPRGSPGSFRAGPPGSYQRPGWSVAQKVVAHVRAGG